MDSVGAMCTGWGQWRAVTEPANSSRHDSGRGTYAGAGGPKGSVCPFVCMVPTRYASRVEETSFPEEGLAVVASETARLASSSSRFWSGSLMAATVLRSSVRMTRPSPRSLRRGPDSCLRNISWISGGQLGPRIECSGFWDSTAADTFLHAHEGPRQSVLSRWTEWGLRTVGHNGNVFMINDLHHSSNESAGDMGGPPRPSAENRPLQLAGTFGRIGRSRTGGRRNSRSAFVLEPRLSISPGPGQPLSSRRLAPSPADPLPALSAAVPSAGRGSFVCASPYRCLKS